ncbi:uncharacterized protein LOC111276446 [Durio zibethinus]|uniref:Uncharacterized protein LOC111276446 n=1 Tax=Durio zibethinus TaxID=66656 RepID=A0A6P5WP75_DURZI|nr:uncharacterized protein LOC111276446 [Durio zibethinus]
MEESSNAIVEERFELMASPAGKNLKVRMAHFITPSIGLGCIDETPVANLTRRCLSSLPTTFEPKKWPLEVKFCGWRCPQRNWKTWVVEMASLHESTWKKAGIFEAIMNSTYQINRNNDLVFGVAEKWCHETKSFLFPWGEATITLEDVMLLGGYSLLGSPVFTPVETEKMEETREKLNNARKEINRSASKKVSHNLWMRKFINSDSEVEHEAFLALWLSRFVLPSSFDVVAESVFPIAIHLARGTRIALAPAVLAKIYRDLSCLKQNIVASTLLESNCDDENVALAISLWSPLLLVQVWIWERFLDLRPKPNLIENGKPRLALWDGLNSKVQDVRSVLDSSKERFEWRPYVRKVTNCDGAKFYGDKAKWILIDSSFDDELLSFARCLRASELVGLDCIEQYLPQRVALQFGMDQDIPGCVSRSNDSPEIAWSDYIKSPGGGKLYIPPTHFEGDVTTQYLKWWTQSVLSLQEQRSFTNFSITPNRAEGMNGSNVFTSCKMIPKSLKRPKQDDTCIGFKRMPKKFKGMRKGKGFSGSNINPKKSKRAKEGTSASTRPDFHLKSLKRSCQFLKQKEKGNNATSVLGSPLKRLKRLSQNPKWKKEVHNAGFVARSSERKRKGNTTPVPHVFPPRSSKGLALGSEVNSEDKNETTSATSHSKPLKELALSFVIRKELNNSAVPPGFPPEGNMLQANGSVNEDKVTAPVLPGFTPKCNVVEAKSSFNEEKVTLSFPSGFPPKANMLKAKSFVHDNKVTAPVPRDFTPKCNVVETESLINEDKMTPLINPDFPFKCVDEEVTPLVPPGFPPKCNMVEGEGSVHEDEVTPLLTPGLPSKRSIVEAKGSVDEAEVTPLVPPGFPPKCNMVEANVSVDEDEVTTLVVPGISPNILEVRDVVEDKVTEKIARSASSRDNMANKVGRYDEKSASHCRSLSLGSHDEDQLTVAEMLKSNDKLDNVDYRDAGENSSGQYQSFSSSIADNELPRCELITTLEAAMVMPAEAANGGSKRATIQDAIESNDGRPADKTMGNDDSSDDKAASIHDIEGYGNSCLNEISKLHLEARISRLERLVAEIKAARKVKVINNGIC